MAAAGGKKNLAIHSKFTIFAVSNYKEYIYMKVLKTGAVLKANLCYIDICKN